VSNPPYIARPIAGLAPEVRHDPAARLTPGATGSSPTAPSPRAGAHLPGGRLMVEIGHDQGAASRRFSGAGLADVTVHPDINGKDRVVAAVAP
jgi:release factor glutamine methyltransferase